VGSSHHVNGVGDKGATLGRQDPLVGPWCQAGDVGPTSGTHWYVQCARKKNGAMFSIGYAQTINDDYVFLFYDDYFGFVIILCAKVPSLMTNDEPVLFRHGMLSSCDENRIVTRESSLMNTFLLVL